MSGVKDPRKELSRELAELLEDPKALRALRLAELLGVFRSAEADQGEREGGPKEGKSSSAEPRPIRIWKPGFEDGKLLFERPPPGPFGDHYATRLRIRADKVSGKHRICYFGDSAAAGYLYAPHLTPAQVLEQQLNHACQEDCFEVIDLARSNDTLAPMLRAVEASLQLDPDLLVIFAGNNWHLLETPQLSPAAPLLRSRQHCALAMRSAGLQGLAHLARVRLEHIARKALERLAVLAGQAAIPVILVLPEVNLADWENRQPVPWLPGEAIARWYELREKAKGQIKSEDFEAARQTASRMQRLDQGLCPTSHRLLAQAWMGLGKPDEARSACQDEVEAAAHYPLLCFLGAPQSTRLVRRVLAQEAQRHRFQCIDLAQVFAQHCDSTLTDRRLFLDYCHLSKEGIQVAMAAVASKVLHLLGDEKGGGWIEVLRDAPSPEISPEAEAAACLGAALHSAHRLLRPDGRLLQHWLRQAVKSSPRAAQAMMELLSARASPCPAVLAAAQQRLDDCRIPVSLQHGWQFDCLDADVIVAVLKVLKDENPQLARQAESRLLEHLAVGPDAVDLSQPPYLWDPLERHFPEVMPTADLSGRAIYRAQWPNSRFCLLSDGKRPIRLEATLRLPAIPGFERRPKGEVHLQVNGAEIASLTVGSQWDSIAAEVQSGQLRRGLNRISLHWPMPPPAGEAALKAAIERLEQGIEADLHPIFGEVYSLLGSVKKG